MSLIDGWKSSIQNRGEIQEVRSAGGINLSSRRFPTGIKTEKKKRGVYSTKITRLRREERLIRSVRIKRKIRKGKGRTRYDIIKGLKEQRRERRKK